MIVKQLEDIVGSESDIDTDTWRSFRILLKKDGMGFSMHHTVIKAGTETYIWYKNHVEAVYCIQGSGEIEVLDNNKIYPIKNGTLYALNGHEKHKLRAKSDMHMVCVFNPPLTGREIHQEDGSYPLLEG
ncbi:Ectoine synthase [Syntrophomonas zehnderi OL-4]|uniref:L-ectoine synthase n=1 Tax=Syntrophomonas zehnderi OL-4 TaxID=690567 RepID=A0A0E4GC29_9FIRM|nr:ectoine synthase [Syntrophomonas zehnderi]CFY07833.1 Ectoine synthase [Syntrophomonas zehnderi OL-4]